MTVGEIATLFNAIPDHLKAQFENQNSDESAPSTPVPGDSDPDKRAVPDTLTIHKKEAPTSYFKQIQEAILKREKSSSCNLTIIPMEGWRRKMHFCDTTLPWIAPSPNLPTPTSALVYPGQVIWEGTNISEGRGTTQPFELFGAPFLDTDAILEEIAKNGLVMPADTTKHGGLVIFKQKGSLIKIHGATLRPVAFQPTSGKWHGQVCRGFQIHVHAPSAYQPYQTSLLILQAIIKRHPDQFQ